MRPRGVDALLAKQAITEVIYRYCRALDRMDRELALSCWHEGATVDYGESFSGTATGFLDWVWPLHRDLFRAHSHQVANILIEVDGDRAASESYVTVTLRGREDAGVAVDIVGRGRYLDQWSEQAGIWAIDRRRFVTDIRSTYRSSDSGPTDELAPGRRDRHDPSYELLTIDPTRAATGQAGSARPPA